MSEHSKALHEIINYAVGAVKPSELIPKCISLKNDNLTINEYSIELDQYKNVYIIGAGKASAFMAKEIEFILGERIKDGFVSTNKEAFAKCGIIKIHVASHPLPDNDSLRAGEIVFNIASNASKDDLVICLISGGGSSLMELLPNTINLEDFIECTDLLIKCGAEINEINSVRCFLSRIKAGKLADAIYPATFVSLIISDVIDDNVATIASGPTCLVHIENSPNDVIEKYNLFNSIPSSIVHYIKAESRNNYRKKIKTQQNSKNIVIGNNLSALNAAKIRAESLGYETSIEDFRLSGEAALVGKNLANVIKTHSNASTKKCLLFGGETTVTVKQNGIGGRNQELVLSSLIELEDVNFKFIFASIGTDGKDGPTDAAGAFIDDQTYRKVNDLGLNPQIFLDNNDSYSFFQKIGSLIKTGPTSTNVMDVQIILIH